MKSNGANEAKFKDKIVIDGNTVLELGVENMLYEEKKLDFKSKWSVKEDNIRIQNKFNRLEKNGREKHVNDIVFDPLEALKKPELRLAIMQDTNPGKVFNFCNLFIYKIGF